MTKLQMIEEAKKYIKDHYSQQDEDMYMARLGLLVAFIDSLNID